MKIRICRRSGLPVNLEDRQNYKQKFEELYDKAAALAKTDMLRLNKRISTIERVLLKIYPSVVEIDLPVTAEAWNELHQKFGNILVSSHRDTDEILFIVEDLEENFY